MLVKITGTRKKEEKILKASREMSFGSSLPLSAGSPNSATLKTLSSSWGQPNHVSFKTALGINYSYHLDSISLARFCCQKNP